jgi:hypothetical protein
MVTLIALAIVVAIWASGNTLSGSAIRQWLDVALQHNTTLSVGLRYGLFRLLFAGWLYVTPCRYRCAYYSLLALWRCAG